MVAAKRRSGHWWEEEHVVGKVRDMLLRNKAPGADDLRAVETLEGLRAWFDENGAAYIARWKK